MKSWFQQPKTKPMIRPRPPEQPAPSADLWDHVLDMDWPRVIQHAQEHPQDAQWQDGHWHETPLYLACQQNPPVEAIRAIVQAYPEAVLIPRRANKDLPIHIACCYQATTQVIEQLVKDFPVTSVEQTRWGRTPVMTLWEFRRKDVPLQEDDVFWEKILVLLRAVAKFREDSSYQSQQPATRTKEFRSTSSAFSHDMIVSHENRDGLSLVHAAVSLGELSCPAEVLAHVLERWPHQVFQRDKWGQLPLHIAVGPTSWSHTTRRKYKPREQQFLALLLHAYPEAANVRLKHNLTRFDDNSSQNAAAAAAAADVGVDIDVNVERYPLHMSLVNRHTWSGGVEDLFFAAPHALVQPDPLTRLYPFQLAAIPVGDTTVELDTIYQLLRVQPNVLTFFDFTKMEKDEINTPLLVGLIDTAACGIVHTRQSRHYALLGTISAILIGGVAGFVFSD
jgi:hypothetical protein